MRHLTAIHIAIPITTRLRILLAGRSEAGRHDLGRLPRRRLGRLLLAGVLAVGAFDVSVASAGSPSERDQMEIAFRQEFGLRSDLAFVHQVRADASATSPGEDVYPVPLTPVERADMDRRREVEAQLGPAQAYAEQHAASFGGMYIDQAAGGVLTLQGMKPCS